jgi:hypothetical protein
MEEYCECGCGKVVAPGKRFITRHNFPRTKTVYDHLLRLKICEPTTLPTGCWEWMGSKNRDGYGHVWLNGRLRSAHQMTYEHFVGPVPEGLELDHLCRNPACANYEHLEPVPHRVNVLRGAGVSAVHAVKTHCIHGHEFTPENTYIGRRGNRSCRECTLISVKASYLRRKEAKAR